MRRVTFDEPKGKKWKRWRRKCDNERQQCIAAIESGRMYRVKGLYRSQRKLFRDPNGPFRGRCAYCERDVNTHRGDIEHYRPKAGVLHEDWSAVTRGKGERAQKHPGYYWLTYDWKNLLLSCISCNQVAEDRAWGKGNRFPVEGDHAWTPGELNQERPKLVHPVLEDPTEHMSLDPETGILQPRTERGRATIHILGLNATRDLPAKRRRLISDISAQVNEAFARIPFEGAEPVVARLRDLKAENDRREFASVADFAFSRSIEPHTAVSDKARQM